MEAYEQLRRAAVEKRDQAIRDARERYREDVAAIERLYRSLPQAGRQKPQKRQPAIVGLILDLMPRDGPFTIADLMVLLRQADPTRPIHEPSVRTYVSRLAARGQIRKLHKSHHNYTLWQATGAPSHPFAELTLADIAEHLILERGPLTTTEVVIAAQSAGYRTDTAPHCLRRAFQDAFRREYRRFERRANGKWRVVITQVG